MLVALTVAGLVSGGIAIDLAAFVAGGILEGSEALLPLVASALVGFGHILGQIGSPQLGLAVQAVAAGMLACAALLFVPNMETARAISAFSAVSVLELAFVAPSDLGKL
jgi:hypothetical protein